MTTLLDLCSLVRSKNAGPFTLTFDFMCRDEAALDALVASDVLTPERFAGLYGTAIEDVAVTVHRHARAVKVTVPRPVVQGAIADNDSYAGQQYGPLMDLEFDVPAGA
jgi:hypothetical protein